MKKATYKTEKSDTVNDVTIKPKMLKGTVTVPPSKSVLHRAIISAFLSKKTCTIHNVAFSDDIKATLNGIKALGCYYKNTGNTITLYPDLHIDDEIEIDCIESGSTLRFLIPIALLTGKKIKFTGRGRLMQRPINPYIDIFNEKGIHYEINEDNIVLSGQLKGGIYKLKGDVSSQFITGLLMALPLAKEDSEIIITTETESKGYIDITLNVLSDFGIKIENQDYKRYIIKGGQEYNATEYTAEGDYSQAAFFLVADALGCDIVCKGLNENSLQGDKEILNILKKVGCKIEKTSDGIKAQKTDEINGITVDVRDIPDLVPVLAVLFGFCKGESHIINAGRLRMKESDRLSAITQELKKLSVDITEEKDSLKIIGNNEAFGAVVSSWGDHRIAMALSIAAFRCKGDNVTILGAENAVKKSYPDFFEIYKNLAE